MYAVIVSGGKQYRVEEGQTLKLATIPAEIGSTVDFNEILLLANGDTITVGSPHVSGGKVVGTILSHGRDKKIHIIKFRRRKHHMKRMGHRQNYTTVKIEKITS